MAMVLRCFMESLQSWLRVQEPWLLRNTRRRRAWGVTAGRGIFSASGLAALAGEPFGQRLQLRQRLLGQLAQHGLTQPELADEAPATHAHGQVGAHAEALAQAQLAVEIVAGMGYQFLAGQHWPVSSKCSRVANTLSRARCSSTRTLESERSRRLQMASSSRPWRSRSSSTLD